MKRIFILSPILILLSASIHAEQRTPDVKTDRPFIESIRSVNEYIHRAVIDNALSRGIDINQKDAYGNSVVMLLLDEGKESAAEYLIAKGADLSATNLSGETAAHIAAKRRSYRALYLIAQRKGPISVKNRFGEKPVDRFLKSGYGATLSHWKAVTGNARSFGKDRGYLKARDTQKKSPVLYAARAGNFESFSFMIQNGMAEQVEWSDWREYTDLFYSHRHRQALAFIFRANEYAARYEKIRLLEKAVRDDDIEMTRFLLDEGALVNRTYSYEAPAICAARSVPIAQLLLSHGAGISAGDLSRALSEAIKKENLSLVRFFVEKRVPLKSPGKPYFLVAAETGNRAILSFLLEHGASTENYPEITWADDPFLLTPLTAAARNTDTDVISFIWDMGIDRSSAGRALCEAVCRGNIDQYRFLRNKGVAYTAANDPEGNSLLHHVSESNNQNTKELVRILITEGNDPNARNSIGQTPLHRASFYKKEFCAGLLIAGGAGINAQDNRGDTPLHVAIQGGGDGTSVVEKLLSSGAKCDLRNLDGKTPYDVALECGRDSIVEKLAKTGAGEWNESVKNRLLIRQITIEHDYEILPKVIGRIENPDIRDEYGNTLLSAAFSHYDVPIDMARELHARGGDLFARDMEGFTVLQNAFLGEDMRKISYLVSQIYDVGIPAGDEAETIAKLVKENRIRLVDLWPGNIDSRWDLRNSTPLVDAMMMGNTEFVKFLLLLGADPNRRDVEGVTPMMRALLTRFPGTTLSLKDMKVLSLVIDHGADVNARNNDGVTPLIYASVAGNLPAVRMLLEKGARINDRDNDGWSALMHACENGKDGIARELVSRGADIASKGKDGLDAATLCAVRGNNALLQVLKARGAKKPDAKMIARYRLIRMIRLHRETDAKKIAASIPMIDFTDKYGMTPLMWAIMEYQEVLAKYLISRGASVNKKCAIGTTPLMLAVRKRQIEMVELLVRRGSDVNAAGKDGNTALGDALKTFSYADVAEFLCKAGADCKARFPDGTPVLFNCLRNSDSDLRILVSQGFDLNVQDREGRTLLMLAAFKGYQGLVMRLITGGADLSVKDAKGRTVLDYAAAGGSWRCVQKLHEAGCVPTAKSCAVMGDYYRNDRLYSTSVQWYERALSLDPDINVRNGCGISLMRAGKLDDAEKAFLKALSDHPDDPMPYYNLCCLFTRKGDRNAAFLWLDRAIEKGMRDRAFMKQDIDLAPLRDDSRYASIMAAKVLPVKK